MFHRFQLNSELGVKPVPVFKSRQVHYVGSLGDN